MQHVRALWSSGWATTEDPGTTSSMWSLQNSLIANSSTRHPTTTTPSCSQKGPYSTTNLSKLRASAGSLRGTDKIYGLHHQINILLTYDIIRTTPTGYSSSWCSPAVTSISNTGFWSSGSGLAGPEVHVLPQQFGTLWPIPTSGCLSPAILRSLPIFRISHFPATASISGICPTAIWCSLCRIFMTIWVSILPDFSAAPGSSWPCRYGLILSYSAHWISNFLNSVPYPKPSWSGRWVPWPCTPPS